MALFTPPRSPIMNTRTGLAPRTLPVHLLRVASDMRTTDAAFPAILSAGTEG